ncbi:hypothetical protein CUZ56_02012 [Saezia sanguinis]|jgi:putative membrane protein|uniref:Inner membrane protein YjfL n=1 Tax=Saezia sanguinis TaxID=1965230 RepID=A0A433SC15_9BURK|nr:DUF350 domain-containing protein [Saezia sanguinis]RUS66287.1 hypothetical protein CUZ56_02012 [Saezia sanguinis]
MSITITLSQFSLYLSYIGAGILMMAVFIFIYVHMTPVKELTLIKEGCVAAALSFGGALVGFSLTLASSIAHADNLLTFMVWGACSAVVQLLVFFVIARLIPNARMELEDNNVAVGTLFCVISLGIGIINAACLS